MINEKIYDILLEILKENYKCTKGEFDDYYYGKNYHFVVSNIRGTAKDCGVSEKEFNKTKIIFFDGDDRPQVLVAKIKG